MATHPRTTTVVTVSDGVAAGVREDASGAALADRLTAAGWDVVERLTVPDEPADIRAVLTTAAAAGRALVVTTGGTGLGPRDVTPEATRAVADRPVPGLAEAMRATGRASTPMADLSRGEVVVVAATLVVNTPGSVRGAVESLDAILDLLGHATQLLSGDTQQHPTGHGTGSVPHDDRPHDEHGQDQHDHDAAHGHHPDDVMDAHPHLHDPDDPCHLAHTAGVPDERRPGTLVAVYASPLASLLLAWGRDLGYRRLVLVEPTGDGGHAGQHADEVVTSVDAAGVDADSDVVVTDHGRDDIVELCDQMLASDARWLGLMGSARHTGPHADGLRTRGRTQDEIDRIERPVGLDIGSRTPPEIALSVLAGLVADRHGSR